MFCWYPSAAKQGYEQSNVVAKPFDEDQGPALIFADVDQSIYLADMSGDGLVDLLLFRDRFNKRDKDVQDKSGYWVYISELDKSKNIDPYVGG